MSNDSSSIDTGKTVKRWPGIVGTILLTAVIFIVGQVVGTLLVTMILEVAGQSGVGDDGTTLLGSSVLLQFIYAATAYGLMVWMLLWIFNRRKLRLADIGLVKRFSWREAVWTIVGFLAYMGAYAILITIVQPLVPGLDVEQKQDIGFDGAVGFSLIWVFAALVVIAPLAEEILMRGFLFTSLRRKLPFWLTAVITSVIFAALHLGGGEAGAGLLWIAAFDTFLLSGMLCYLRETTGRIWAGVGVHMIKNGVAFAALFIFGVGGG